MKLLRFCIAGAGALLAAGHTWASECHLKDFGTLPVEMINGQPTTMVKINGTDMRFEIDTGSFFNLMSRANATSLGLRLKDLPDDMNLRIGGVGGDSWARYTRIKQFGILGSTFDNVDFIVGGSDTGYGLIGANLLNFGDLEIDLAHGKVTLFKSDGCDKTSLAYWVKDSNYSVADIAPSTTQSSAHQVVVLVSVNGKTLHAAIDTGAVDTMLSRAAAERIGIDLNGPGTKPAIAAVGIGSKAVKSWAVDIDSFAIGGETIRHTQILVLDGALGGGSDNVDMLLGADFLLAHRVFIANSQGKVYVTYNGGRVFALADIPSNSENFSGGSAAALQNAADYALRGEADLSRNESGAAVADLDQAVRLSPDQPDYRFARARALMAENKPDAALADLDKALSLDRKNVDALLMRARIRHSRKDIAGATADVNAASALTPPGGPHSFLIASLYVALDQPAAALPLLDAWIAVHNNDVQMGLALNERCWARSLSNQMLDDALSDCRKAIRRDGEISAYLDSLGMVQLRLGHYPEAISAYQQAIAKNPGSAWTHYGLGLAKIRSGQKDAGNAELVQARKINPEIDMSAAKFGLTDTAR
jgi:tetratricopeptide (TPR) repeat protein/predicted aspartyl protease